MTAETPRHRPREPERTSAGAPQAAESAEAKLDAAGVHRRAAELHDYAVAYFEHHALIDRHNGDVSHAREMESRARHERALAAEELRHVEGDESS
jgi:hypothetical protein